MTTVRMRPTADDLDVSAKAGCSRLLTKYAGSVGPSHFPAPASSKLYSTRSGAGCVEVYWGGTYTDPRSDLRPRTVGPSTPEF